MYGQSTSNKSSTTTIIQANNPSPPDAPRHDQPAETGPTPTANPRFEMPPRTPKAPPPIPSRMSVTVPQALRWSMFSSRLPQTAYLPDPLPPAPRAGARSATGDRQPGSSGESRRPAAQPGHQPSSQGGERTLPTLTTFGRLGRNTVLSRPLKSPRPSHDHCFTLTVLCVRQGSRALRC